MENHSWWHKSKRYQYNWDYRQEYYNEYGEIDIVYTKVINKDIYSIISSMGSWSTSYDIYKNDHIMKSFPDDFDGACQYLVSLFDSLGYPDALDNSTFIPPVFDFNDDEDRKYLMGKTIYSTDGNFERIITHFKKDEEDNWYFDDILSGNDLYENYTFEDGQPCINEEG